MYVTSTRYEVFKDGEQIGEISSSYWSWEIEGMARLFIVWGRDGKAKKSFEFASSMDPHRMVSVLKSLEYLPQGKYEIKEITEGRADAWTGE